MAFTQNLRVRSELSAVLTKRDGTQVNLGILRTPFRLWLAGFLKSLWRDRRGLVTTAGVNYMATDFTSGGATPTISGFKYHDCGTGTNAAATGDTALQTPAGTARVVGTPSNPSANIYRTVAQISFTSSLAITEWGLFSASSSGTLWDRRVFSARNVDSGESITFTYDLTIPAGGS
jgi:hypothetical protein